MAKTTGALESLIRGVSQQVPHDRLPGQHWLQDNFLSDPVRGLARRHGSVLVHEKRHPSLVLSAASKDDATNFKEISFSISGKEYSFMYRPEAKPAGSTVPGLVAINKDSGKIMTVEVPAGDGVTTAVIDQGINSITTVGQFILFAARAKETQCTTHDMLASTQQYGTVWVRGGAYSRKYTVNAYRADGSLVTASYTTPASYYEGTLNTSDIPTSASDYQKQVNDRVNAYNTAVNQHIASAGRAIQPENIAEQLRIALTNAGYAGISRSGPVLQFSGLKNITVDDGGDGSFLKATASEVASTNDLSTRHMVGKTVRVTPKQGDFSSPPVSYYLKARPATAGLTAWQEVIWEEGPGLEVRPGFMFLIGYVSGDTLYVGSTPAFLQGITGLADIPTYEFSSSGDAESSPVPAFFNKTIDYLRTFQDRLMIVSGATVFLSKSGDYFNFFRASALTLADDDPIEVFAMGSEGDVISASVQMDRSLILFGKRQQYALPGREAITPRNAYIAVQSSYEDATDSPPVASGNLIFFTQQRSNRLTVQQMQTGAYADSYDSFDITTQLDGYMIGKPKQVVAMTSPSQLFIRTKEFANGVYVYSYLDASGAETRLFDSWSRFVWDESLGTLLGISSHDSNLLTLTLRQGSDGAYLVLDRFVRESRRASLPYVDSARPWSQAASQPGTIKLGWAGADRTAVVLKESAGDFYLLGRDLDEYATLFAAVPGQEAHAIVGTYFTSEVEPTAPYQRDYKDRAVLDGRQVINKFVITVSDSAAMNWDLTCFDGIPKEGPGWVHRPAGQWVLNKQQVAQSASVTVAVMKEIRDYRLRLKSRNWLPLTISAMEWSGQFFTSRRR